MDETIAAGDTAAELMRQALETKSNGPITFYPTYDPSVYMDNIDEFHQRGERPPNCIGFGLATLGVLPQEMNIPGGLAGLPALLAEYFERTDNPNEADLLVVVETANGNPGFIAHMAVLNHSEPGKAIERSFEGARVTQPPLADVLGYYSQRPDGSTPDFQYLKKVAA